MKKNDTKGNTEMTIRISLGTYSLEVGKDIQEKFNAIRNQVSERHPNRLHAQILLRARGHRSNLYKKVRIELSGGRTETRFRSIANGQDLPMKYAQRVAVYLILKENKKEKNDTRTILLNKCTD